MKPRGMLMIEHRLIEKVLVVANNKAKAMTARTFDPLFIDAVVDFIRVYADRTHHGKEEEILFQKLSTMKLDSSDARMMAELIDEHAQARAKVKAIREFNEKFKRGDAAAALEIARIIDWLAAFYPVHIQKEDKIFFPNTEAYFSASELDALLGEFNEFDRKMIHEKYQNVYKELSQA